MERLRKKRYTNRGGGDKYYINCAAYENNPDSLEMKTLVRNTKETDVAILKAVANDETIKKKNKDVVVKIGLSNYITKKEFDIGQKLFESKIPGFIKYLCLFSCYDDTTKTQPKIEPNSSPIVLSQNEIKICTANPQNENKKDVLVMPFIKDGSVEKCMWNLDNIHILNGLIVQAVMSLARAFEKLGFIHGDLHPGNLLFKFTKREIIKYEFNEFKSDVPTFEYKIVLMDFEKSITELNEPEYFWADLRKLFTRLDGLDIDNFTIEWKNKSIISFTEEMMDNEAPLCNNNISMLIDMIQDSKFVFRKNAMKPVYDPAKY